MPLSITLSNSPRFLFPPRRAKAARRHAGRSEILLMPEYRESRALRLLEAAADALRHYPNHPQGQAIWTDRVFVDLAIEIMLSRRSQGGLSLTTMSASLPVELIDQVRATPGVRAATPVAQHLEFNGEGALGLRQVDGVDFDDYRRATYRLGRQQTGRSRV